MSKTWFLVCVSLGCLALSHGYENGAPVSACADMFPSGHDAQAQTGTVPYTLTLNSTTYNNNGAVEVTLTTTSEDGFEGFFVQARRADCSNSGKAIGSFSLANNNAEVKGISCPGPGGTTTQNSAVTQTDSNDMTVKKFIWSNPGGEDVYFQATVVKNKVTFWTNIRSDYLYNAAKQPGANHGNCDGNNNVMTTTATNNKPATTTKGASTTASAFNVASTLRLSAWITGMVTIVLLVL